MIKEYRYGVAAHVRLHRDKLDYALSAPTMPELKRRVERLCDEWRDDGHTLGIDFGPVVETCSTVLGPRFRARTFRKGRR